MIQRSLHHVMQSIAIELHKLSLLLTSIRLSSVLLMYSSSCSARTWIDTDAIRKLLFSSSSDCTLPFRVSTWPFSSRFSSSRRLYARSADSSGEPGDSSESRRCSTLLMSLLLQLAALRLLQLPLILSTRLACSLRYGHSILVERHTRSHQIAIYRSESKENN